MKNIYLILIIFYSQLLTAKQGIKVKNRCEDDLIGTKEQVEERVRWYAKCFFSDIEDESIGSSDEEKQSFWINLTLYKNADPLKGYKNIIDFPVFTDESYSHVWISPKDRNASCEVKEGFKARMFCESGCYSGSMKIRLIDGDISIKEAKSRSLFSSVMVLEPGSHFDQLEWKYLPIDHYLEDLRPVQQELLRFHTESGSLLEVTKNHPLVAADGNIKTADSFRIGQFLVKADGSYDQILRIEPFAFYGKVYNIFPASKDLYENIVIAEGLLNGSGWYQNEGMVFLNRIMLRRGLSDHLVRSLSSSTR